MHLDANPGCNWFGHIFLICQKNLVNHLFPNLFEAGKDLFGLTQKAAALECTALTMVIPVFCLDFSLPEHLFSPLWQNTQLSVYFNGFVESFGYQATLYSTFKVQENTLLINLEDQRRPSGGALVIKVKN